MRRFFCITLLCLCGAELQAAHRSIAESVQLSLQYHPDIKVRLAELEKSQAQLEQEEASFLPQVRVSAGIGRENSDNNATRAANAGGSEELERRESAITLRQMLFDGFETHWRRESQQDLQEAVQRELEQQANDLALRAVEQHLAVASYARITELHWENLRRHEEIARDVGARARSGKDDRARVSQIAARVALAQANLETAREQLQHATSAYREVTGTRPAHTLLLQDGLVKLPDSLELLLLEVRERNARILAEQARDLASEDAWKASRNHHMPKLFFETGASWQSNLDGQKGPNQDAYAMFRVHYDLYQGGAGTAQQRQARLSHAQQEYRLSEVTLQTVREAEQAWHSYTAQGRRINYLQDFVEAAEQTRSAYQKQFSIGQRSLIDLLDAENEVLRARSELTESSRALYLVKYRLLALQNRLLDALEIGELIQHNEDA